MAVFPTASEAQPFSDASSSPAENDKRPFSQLFLCSSRACLGIHSVWSRENGAKKETFPHQVEVEEGGGRGGRRRRGSLKLACSSDSVM